MPVVHGKPCVCNLILVPAGMGATVIQGIAVLVTYKCKGEKVSRIDQFLGISGITDKNIDITNLVPTYQAARTKTPVR